jgi:oligoendopeptidase F
LALPPWIEDLRKEKPYQLDDKLEQLFHEKAVSGRGAWNRLFNETMTAMRFEVGKEKLSLEPTLNLLLDKDEKKRKAGAEALARAFKENVAHADRQHARWDKKSRPLARPTSPFTASR